MYHKFGSLYGMILFVFVALSVFLTPALGQSKNKTSITASLNRLKTIEEVELFYQQTSMEFQQLGKEQGREEDARQGVAKLANACCERVLRLSKSDDDRAKGYRLKLAGLKILIDAGNQDGIVQTQSLIKELRRKKGLTTSAEAAEHLFFMARLRLIESERMSGQAFEAFIRETEKLLKYESLVGHYPEIVTSVMQTTRQVAKTKDSPQWIDKAGEVLAESLKDGALNEEEKGKLLFAIKGFCCRGVGKPLDLYGKTIDGHDFDWSTYRGKVVLVNFTASWCKPCMAELPKIFDAYQKYRNQGLEVVSVGVFDSDEKLKEMIANKNIPWTFLSETSTKDAGQESQAARYAIRTIPVMLLIGRDGRILSDEVRGTLLEERLSEIFSH